MSKRRILSLPHGLSGCTPPFDQVAASLAKNGYRPIPVKQRQKAPVPNDWPNYKLTSSDVRRYRGCGVGIICGNVIGVDIDVPEPLVAAETEKLAGKMLGSAPRRTGQAPKVLRLYRVSGDPFRKIATAGYRLRDDSPEGKPHRVEILAEGQQFVAYNIHPDTGKPYRWNGAGDPLSVPAAKLTAVTQEQVKKFLRAADAMLSRRGEKVGAFAAREAEADEEHKPNPVLRARDFDSLRAALASIPNDDVDYDSWIRICLAIKGALGDNGHDDWMRWSKQSQKHIAETSARAWKDAKPERIGAGTIYFHAEQNGWRRDSTEMPSGARQGTVRLLCASEVEMEQISWLWPGWLAAGKLHILAGVPGTGKTNIALSLAATITRATNWPDGSPCEHSGNVLIWSGEDDPGDTLVPRLTAMGADLSRVHFVDGVRTSSGDHSFDPAHDMPALITAARRVGDVRLLIVDPIVSAVAGDSHKNAEVRRSLQPLVTFGQECRAAVFGVSHFSKGTTGKDPLDRITGSLAFGALARLVFGAAKKTDGACQEDGRVFVRIKSNIGPDGGALAYSLETARLENSIEASRVHWGEKVDGSAREILADAEHFEDGDSRSAVDEAKAFLQYALESEPMPARDLRTRAEEAGISWPAIRRAEKALGVEHVKAGMDGGWSWRLSPKALKSSEDAHEN